MPSYPIDLAKPKLLIDTSLLVDASQTFNGNHVEGILAKEVAGIIRLDVILLFSLLPVDSSR